MTLASRARSQSCSRRLLRSRGACWRTLCLSGWDVRSDHQIKFCKTCRRLSSTFSCLNSGPVSCHVDAAVLAQPAGPPFSAAELEAQRRLHTFLADSAAFRRHVFEEWCKQRRTVELLALPRGLHSHLADFLSKVRVIGHATLASVLPMVEQLAILMTTWALTGALLDQWGPVPSCSSYAARVQDASLVGVQWLQRACCGEAVAAAEALQRLCREPNCASGTLLEVYSPADRTPSAQAAAVRSRAAMLCRVATLRDKKEAMAAGAWDAAATTTELRACGAFGAAAELMRLLAARGHETATATDVPVRTDRFARLQVHCSRCLCTRFRISALTEVIH